MAIRRTSERAMELRQRPKMISCRGEHIAGPETAARLGVPVGTVVGVRETRWYRNPIRNLWWRLTHPGTGRVNFNLAKEG